MVFSRGLLLLKRVPVSQRQSRRRKKRRVNVSQRSQLHRRVARVRKMQGNAVKMIGVHARTIEKTTLEDVTGKNQRKVILMMRNRSIDQETEKRKIQMRINVVAEAKNITIAVARAMRTNTGKTIRRGKKIFQIRQIRQILTQTIPIVRGSQGVNVELKTITRENRTPQVYKTYSMKAKDYCILRLLKQKTQSMHSLSSSNPMKRGTSSRQKTS